MIAALQFLLTYILPFLIIISVIIAIHELGHFWAARACGVAIDRFSLGFGKPILAKTDKHGVEWRIGWLPLGGYVRFAGDSNDASLPDANELEHLRQQINERLGPGAEKRFYHFKPVWQRAIIAAAGPAANFVLAILLLTIFFSVIVETRVLPRVGGVMPNSAAAAAGFQPGDLIRSAYGKPITGFDQMQRVVLLHAGDPIPFEVERNGRVIRLVATPSRKAIKDPVTGSETRMGQLGLWSSQRPEDLQRVTYTPIEAFGASFTTIADVMDNTFTYLGRVFTGRESGDQLNGVIGMAQASGAIVKATVAEPQKDMFQTVGRLVMQMAFMAALVSVGIGLVNLLPIPMLDGGHLMFYAYEAVARRPVAASIQEASYRVGLALVASLMLFAAWNDLQRLRAFEFLGGLFS